MVVPASITAIATGCRLVGRSTISPQPRSGAAHAPRPQRSRLMANGGVSMTPCSTPCPAGRRTKGRGQSRRASTPGAAGSTASGHRGCGVSAPDERKGMRWSKAAFARSSSRWGARHCRGSSWMHRKQSPAPLLPGSGRSGPAGISCQGMLRSRGLRTPSRSASQ